MGVSVTKSWNRRPLIGRLDIAWLSSVTSDVSVVVSTAEVAAVTVTSSATPASVSVKLIVRLAPTVSVTSSIATAPKPASSARTS